MVAGVVTIGCIEIIGGAHVLLHTHTHKLQLVSQLAGMGLISGQPCLCLGCLGASHLGGSPLTAKNGSRSRPERRRKQQQKARRGAGGATPVVHSAQRTHTHTHQLHSKTLIYFYFGYLGQILCTHSARQGVGLVTTQIGGSERRRQMLTVS